MAVNEDQPVQRGHATGHREPEAGPGEDWILRPLAPAVWRTAVSVGVSPHTWGQPSATRVIPGPMLQQRQLLGYVLVLAMAEARGSKPPAWVRSTTFQSHGEAVAAYGYHTMLCRRDVKTGRILHASTW